MTTVSTKNSLRKNVFSYWDEQKLAGNLSLEFIQASHYGANQDFVNTTCAALMPKVGYIRPETVSVYFRAYKARVKAAIKSTSSI